MRNSKLIVVSCFGLTAVGLGMFVGCDQAEPVKNPPTVTPLPHTPVTGEDVKREVGEAAETTKEYLGQKKDEFAAQMNEKLKKMDAKLEDMEVEGEKLSGEAKEKWDASMESLKVKRDEMSVKLEELKKSSGAAWEDMKAGLEKAGEEVDSAAKDAWEKLKGSDSEDATTTPEGNL